MTTTQKKWLKWALIALILAAIIAVAYYFLKPKPVQPNYITAPVTRSNLENSVMATGKIEAVDQVDVGAQVSGEVTRLYVDVGDMVKQGDIIAQIDPIKQRNTLTNQQASLQQSMANLESTRANYATRQQALATARADLASRQATLSQAQTEYNRMKNLAASNAVSRQELERAATSLKTAQADVLAAQNAIRTAQANIVASQADIATAQASIRKSQTEVNTAEQNLGYTRITAPMNGTVISVTTKQGQTVNANQTAPTIVTLADLNTVRIKAKISEADVINLKPGMPVYFNIIGAPDQRFNATLKAIEPAPEGTTAMSTSTSKDTAVYYIGYFDVPNPDGQLRINMTAQVYIVENNVTNTLNVPAAAVKRDPKLGTYVQVVQADGTTKQQPVKVGVTNRVNTQIISGITEGQKVVIGESTNSGSGGNSSMGSARARASMM